MNKLLFSLILTLLLPTWLAAQTQTVRGRVIDEASQQPLVGATVKVFFNDKAVGGGNTNESGQYKIANIPVGRLSLEVTYIGYATYKKDNLRLIASASLVHDVPMQAVIMTAEGGVVYAKRDPSKPRVEGIPSGRAITPEVNKIVPGAVDDPSRLVQAFPGVQASQDNNTDLVIRGNSPAGLLWRLEGIDIPNPNHFARKGNTGGGITAFSAQVLGESDFASGAWSAEYGNAYSGVFDMRFRKGNNEERKYRFRMALIGIDASAEGPFKKGRGSYLVNYRYSTLGILNDLGFRLVGERIDNNFQDLSFNIVLPSEDQNTTWTLFGFGGLSEEIWDPIEDSLGWSRDYRTDRTFTTQTGATGITFTHVFTEKNSYLRAVVAASGSRVMDNDDTLDVRRLGLVDPFAPNDPELANTLDRGPWEREDYRDWRISSHVFYNQKIGDYSNFRAGVMGAHINFAFDQRRDPIGTEIDSLVSLVNGSGSSQLLQAYSQFYLSLSPRWRLRPGVHAMYLTLNGSFEIDPRISLSFNATENQSFTLAYGIYSSILPLGNYFTEVEGVRVNEDLDMVRSHHFLAGYDLTFGQDRYKLSVQTYMQRLFQVPVVPSADSAFWLLNRRDGYATQDLVSEGRGLNYGLDVVLERRFQAGLFYLLTGSLYQSLYSTRIPDTLFNTRYNGYFSLSLMGGKEWTFKDTSSFMLSGRLVWNGGQRFSPIDAAASAEAGYRVEPPLLTYSELLGQYFRIDGKISYRKKNWNLFLEVQNMTARLNPRDQIWDSSQNIVVNRNQAGLIPNIGFTLDF